MITIKYKTVQTKLLAELESCLEEGEMMFPWDMDAWLLKEFNGVYREDIYGVAYDKPIEQYIDFENDEDATYFLLKFA